MAVDAVASVVLEKLKDLLTEESFTSNKVIRSQLEDMKKALEKMRVVFIEAAANEEKSVKDVKKWTDEYLTNLYDVEDSIESFALRIARQRKRLGFLMNHALFLKRFTACKMLSRKLDKIQKKIEELNHHKHTVHEKHEEKQQDYEEMEPNSSAFLNHEEGDNISPMRKSTYTPTFPVTEGSPRSLLRRSHPFKLSSDGSLNWERWQHSKLMYSYSYDEQVASIVGYKHEVPEIMKRLTEVADQDGRVVSVVGEMGSGKTMLARAVYGNRTIKNWFDTGFCAWATIFKESTSTDILLNLLKQVEQSKEEDDTIDEKLLKGRLRQKLKDHRYLIVLDGVQSPHQWESLKDAFPDEQNGSKIMITTCEEHVGFLADPKRQPHFLKKLDREESWTLFLKKVGLEESPDSECPRKERFMQVCGGLPLNIVLLGSYLSTKKDKEKEISEWTWIPENQENWRTSDILMLSYNDLNDHLKLCLLYMLLFPKELDVPVRRLKRLWLAEGFVKRPEEDQVIFQEDVVQGYFDNLVKRSLILVSKLRSDGSPRKCRLLGVVHDFLLAKARDIGLYGRACDEDGPFGKRRLIDYPNGKNCSLEAHEYQHLRSYISFNLQKKDTPAKDVGDLLTNVIGRKGSGLLRVLDLEGVYRPSLPDNLGDLFHLRYLGLRRTCLDKLPKSVGQLLYLETLDLKHTNINRIPPSIWKLKHLRHLNLNETHLDKDMPLHSHGSLPKLLTLWGLTVDHESPVTNGLSKLTHLRELGISFRFTTCDDDNTIEGRPFPQFAQDLVRWISELTTLQSLRLRSRDDSGKPCDLSLKPLSKLDKLTHLNLFGKLQKLPEPDPFPPNIKVLTLSVSKLDQDPMPILGQLQSLTVLRLLAKSYRGENMVCPRDSFEGLEVLKLWMLKDLKIWELEEGAMKKLKELNIRCCSKLKSIPSRLWQQETFKDLTLTNTDEEKFREAAKQHNSKVSITVKNYNFTPLPWEQGEDAPNGTTYDMDS